MAEDLIREIHTQLDHQQAASRHCPERIALRGFAEPPTSSRRIFKKINGTTYSKSIL